MYVTKTLNLVAVCTEKASRKMLCHKIQFSLFIEFLKSSRDLYLTTFDVLPKKTLYTYLVYVLQGLSLSDEPKIYKSAPLMKLVFLSPKSRLNRKKIGLQLSSKLFSMAAMLLSPLVMFSSEKMQNRSLVSFKVGYFSRETNQKRQHKQ